MPPGCAIVIPVYKRELDSLEQFSVDYSLAMIGRWPCVFVAPEGLDAAYYVNRYPQVRFEWFPSDYFRSVDDYSRLLVTQSFYDRFEAFEFVLLVQPDAIVLRDDLDFWSRQPFDYIGAPWPKGLEFLIKRDQFAGARSRLIKVTVGNGGFSLRRVAKCVALLKEFPESVQAFTSAGANEDAFFSLMGALSKDFIIPNEITASRFSMELQPEYYYAVNGGRYPMGVHAWWLVQPHFWAACVPPLAAVLART
jgi:hypothetical protein